MFFICTLYTLLVLNANMCKEGIEIGLLKNEIFY